MQLREYQSRALSMLYDWLEKNAGHPCVVLPTGSGKSVVIAELCRRAITEWPETRIVMLTRSVELINQNAEKLRTIWPGAPMGIYSASAGKKQLGEPITIGGPLSIVRVTKKIGHCDLLLCDEAHDISHKDEGSYRKIINDLMAVNPSMRVIGFTASPFRLGHGMITDKPAIFDALIEPVSIMELVEGGYLAPLRSKLTETKLSTEGVHKRGGEYIESELQAAVNTDANNHGVVDEIIQRGSDRKSWLVFCAGVDHAQSVASVLCEKGIIAECVTGGTPKGERERIIAAFKAGKVRALTNANVLTTGFDHPDTDLISMLRPTMSPGLYVQMAGRGMRLKSHAKDCLVLDFAGNVSTHGPITEVRPPTKTGGEGDGEPPVKACEVCGELVNISVKVCPACFTPFPVTEKAPLKLHHDDIMGIHGKDLPVKEWEWRVHTSRASGNDMLRVTYYGAKLSDPKVDEYLPVCNMGYAGEKAISTLASMAMKSGARMPDRQTAADDYEWLGMVSDSMNSALPPTMIEYKMDGKFHRVMRREWINANESPH